MNGSFPDFLAFQQSRLVDKGLEDSALTVIPRPGIYHIFRGQKIDHATIRAWTSLWWWSKWIFPTNFLQNLIKSSTKLGFTIFDLDDIRDLVVINVDGSTTVILKFLSGDFFRHGPSFWSFDPTHWSRWNGQKFVVTLAPPPAWSTWYCERAPQNAPHSPCIIPDNHFTKPRFTST